MKIPMINPWIIAPALACVVVTAADGAPRTNHSASNVVVRSDFVMPSNPKEGRDPFFPDSTRPYATAAASNPKVADVTSLKLLGFSGEVPHRFVIINNHTFAAGDEGDVTTPNGRIHLRCIEVRTNSVLIEVGGQRRELFYSSQP